MGINYTGYTYPIATGSIITTDSTPTSPKPGVAHYVGEVTPLSAQIGDIWTSSTGIRRWSGTAWDLYLGQTATAVSVFKAGSRTFTGSSVTIPFSSVFTSTPSVVVNVSNLGLGSNNSSYINTLVYNVTPSSFSVSVVNVESGTATNVTGLTIDWIATLPTIGTPSNSATTANYFSGVTGAGGIVSIPFNYTYASAPAVVVTAKDFVPGTQNSLYEPRYAVQNVTTTGFDVKVTYGEAGTTPVPAGTSVRFNWIANTTGISQASNPTIAGIFGPGLSTNNGIFNINFGYTYSTPPAVTAFWTNGVVGSDSNFIVQNITTTGFQIRLFENDGGPASNQVGTWSWIATPYA